MNHKEQLIQKFGGDAAHLGIWTKPEFKDSFAARGYPLGIKISKHASQTILDMQRGHNCKEALYILIDYDGDVSRQKGTVTDWVEALYYALTLNLIIYNTRSKKCCRPAWLPRVEKRTINNMMFEAVWCIPDSTVVNKVPFKTTRLFHLDEFNIQENT